MSDASTVLMLLRFGFSLAVVFGMIWFAARFARKQGSIKLGAGSGRRNLEVVDRQALTRHASVAVVSVAGRAVLVGVTDQQVTLLGEAPELDVEEEPFEPVEVDLEEMDLSDAGNIARAADPMVPRRNGAPEGETPPSAWMNIIDTLRERTVRRTR